MNKTELFVLNTALVLLSVGAAASGQDTDGDGIPDTEDNCIVAPNPQLQDTDGDGYGNACDADLNNDCVVNAIDLGLFRVAFFSSEELYDFSGDGTVNIVDLGIMRTLFFGEPGPSGLPGDCDPDTTPPTVPLNLAGAVAGSNVVLAWDPSTDAGGAGLSGYRVFRDGAALPVTASTTFTDVNVPTGINLRYTVSAFDQAGNESAQSQPFIIAVFPPPPTDCSDAVTALQCAELDAFLGCCMWNGSMCTPRPICP